MNELDLGYAITEGVFSDSECADVARMVLGASMVRSRAGIRHLMSSSEVAQLANDARLISLASQWLPAGAVPFRATLFDKSPQSNWLIPWHQDTALPMATRFEATDWGPWSFKAGIDYAHAPGWALARVVALRIHLDASRSDNGPLRVIPGSHRAGVLRDAEIDELVRAHPAVECISSHGAVLAMRPLLVHSSSKALSDEYRVLDIFEAWRQNRVGNRISGL